MSAAKRVPIRRHKTVCSLDDLGTLWAWLDEADRATSGRPTCEKTLAARALGHIVFALLHGFADVQATDTPAMVRAWRAVMSAQVRKTLAAFARIARLPPLPDRPRAIRSAIVRALRGLRQLQRHNRRGQPGQVLRRVGLIEGGRRGRPRRQSLSATGLRRSQQYAVQRLARDVERLAWEGRALLATARAREVLDEAIARASVARSRSVGTVREKR